VVCSGQQRQEVAVDALDICGRKNEPATWSVLVIATAPVVLTTAAHRHDFRVQSGIVRSIARRSRCVSI
jgi:hypothetical protein